MNKSIFFLVFALSILFLSCGEDRDFEEVNKNNKEEQGGENPLNQGIYYQYQKGEEYPIGSKFSVGNYNDQAFGNVLSGISIQKRIAFGQGDRIFMNTFSDDSGLGARFNARSCSNCHFKDGRGRPLESTTDADKDFSRGFLVRLSVEGQDEYGGPKGVFGYGGQLQDRGLEGIGGEAKVKVTYETINGMYPDGTKYTLRKPIYSFYDEKFGSLDGVMISPRVGGQTIGFGFVDALTEQQILVNADENDSDGDGISGRANYVWNLREKKTTIGKFGWKANAPTLEQQIVGALSGDMGMTTSLLPKQNCPSPQQDCNDYVNKHNIVDKIDLSDEKLAQLVMYQATLAVPIRRDVKDKDVLQGKGLFYEMNCIKCHAIGFKVEKSEMVPEINGTVFNPYSDFLLHDMGDDLADNRPDFLANGKEWRTQPLWGIGMIPTVNGHQFLLHDGRANGVEEAILWHGGEAEKSKNKFMNLTKKQREQVIKFVNTL